MDSLIRLLGPAPSEMTPDELAALVRRERTRALAFNPTATWKRKKAKPKKAKPSKPSLDPAIVLAALKAKGCAPEKIQQFLKEMKLG